MLMRPGPKAFLRKSQKRIVKILIGPVMFSISLLKLDNDIEKAMKKLEIFTYFEQPSRT
jgi:hypothetical protein